MATDVGLAHYGWPHEDPTPRDDSQEISVPQMLEHGSISFGRYAVEPLSWEKRSVFTVNRRQEELDKFSTHGLVAQKKAYFEEFYKNIRAAKSSKSNQQIQITLGSNVSTSCHSAEDETDLIIKHPGYGATRNYDYHTEKATKGIGLENAIDRSEAVLADIKENIQVAHLKLQSSPKTSSSLSRKNSLDVMQETVPSHSIQTERVSTKLTTNDAPTRGREIIDAGGIYSNDEEAVPGNNASFSSDNGLVISTQRSATFTAHVRPQKSKSMLLENASIKEAPHKTNQIKQETASVPKVKKDHAPVNRGATKLDCRNKTMCKSSHGSNPVHQKVDKAHSGVLSRRTAADKLSSNDIRSSVSSYKLLLGKRCKVTIPRPFSFATEKRATAPRCSGNAQIPSSKSSTRAAEPTRFGENIKRSVSRLTSSLPHAKDSTDVQGSLNKAATTTSDKGAEIEDKRCNGSKERCDNILRTSEARSFDLPCRKEYGFHDRSEYKLDNPDIKMKEKEAHLSRSVNLSVDSKKPQGDSLPHDRTKLRQEKPHWR